jgi:hypothetical protein
VKTLILVGLAIIAIATLPGCSTADHQSTRTPTFSSVSSVRSLVPFPDMRMSSTQAGLPIPAGQ